MHLIKPCLPVEWKQKTGVFCNQNPNDFAQLRESILYKKFRIPGESEKFPKDVTAQDIYKIFILNYKTQVNSEGYWENKFSGNVIDWNLWFDCNFVNNLMPRKCKDVNWKIFYGQANTDTSLGKMTVSNVMCVVCENDKEKLEHLLIDCRHVYGISDAVERPIKYCTSNSF